MAVKVRKQTYIAGDAGGARTCMRLRALLDTNVLVYAYDRSEPTKQRQALSLSEDFASGSTLDGVAFANPFAGSFSLEHWLG
ncbi:MAG: hypothetical protein ACUVWR_03510 [Anaerolineae bacterium]